MECTRQHLEVRKLKTLIFVQVGLETDASCKFEETCAINFLEAETPSPAIIY